MNADPETVFYYIDPTPESPRSTWDRAIKELQIVANITEVCYFWIYRMSDDGSDLSKQ